MAGGGECGSSQATRTIRAAAQGAAQAAVQTVYPAASRGTRHAIDISAAAASAAAVDTVEVHTVASGLAAAAPASATASPRADLKGGPTSRTKRKWLSLDDKVKLITVKESGAFMP